jgi:hypothetical protein
MFSAAELAEILLMPPGLRNETMLEWATLRKSPDWSYEKEWRIVSSKREEDVGEFSHYPFNPAELSAIFLGPRIERENREALIEASRSFPRARVMQVEIFAAPSPTAAAATGGLIFRTGANTSVDVELVIESTYDTTLHRGDAPPGLAMHVTGNTGYAFSGVPDGHYRILAAFGKDGDVRDQSSTGNATPPTVDVSGGASATASAAFAITPAVDLVSVDDAAVGVDPVVTVTTSQPVFAWTNAGATSADSSASTSSTASGTRCGRPRTWREQPRCRSSTRAIRSSPGSTTSCGSSPSRRPAASASSRRPRTCSASSRTDRSATRPSSPC